MPPDPFVVTHRKQPARAAIVLLHGFGGGSLGTWGQFPQLLMAEPALASWDVFSIGYTTSLAFDIGFWKGDPAITTLGGLLKTVAAADPLDRYESLAFLAHSMGGLVLQRSLLSDSGLRARVSHVLLFGTPSAGLVKASRFKFWNRQIRDIANDSEFITSLRKQWNADFADALPFSFATIAGDQDVFVPPESSLHPFQEAHRRVIYGDHHQIVKPDGTSHLGFKLAVKAICGDKDSTMFDSARLAIESLDFQHAIDVLWPNRHELDDKGLVSLALALDSQGRRDDAIALLSETKAKGTDPLGVLAGRLKRRWLVGNRRSDAERATALYREGLERSEGRNHAQAFYHAINCAFMALAFEGDVTASKDYAAKALSHCQASGADDVWRHATEGDAHLYLGREDAALAAYAKAITHDPDQWQIASIHQQAVRIADLTGNEDAIAKIEDVFSTRSTT